MLLMRLAHKIRYSLSLFALMTVLVASMAAQKLVLDLTKPAAREQQVTSVPGMSVGGVGGEPRPSGYRLPLTVELVSIDPQPIKLGNEFTVEVRLRNTSASAFFLPASQNAVAVLQHEGKGRRTFSFKLIFEDPKSGRKTLSFAASAVGSETAKDSLLRIAPGKEVRVLFIGDLSPIANWSDFSRLQLRAGVSETAFEDRRYFVERRSEELVSENAKTVDLVKP